MTDSTFSKTDNPQVHSPLRKETVPLRSNENELNVATYGLKYEHFIVSVLSPQSIKVYRAQKFNEKHPLIHIDGADLKGRHYAMQVDLREVDIQHATIAEIYAYIRYVALNTDLFKEIDGSMKFAVQNYDVTQKLDYTKVYEAYAYSADFPNQTPDRSAKAVQTFLHLVNNDT